METEFRLYQETDYPDLRDMIFSLYREDPEGESMDEEKIKRTVAEFRKNPAKLNIYMFRRDNKNIGYALLVFFWSNEYGGNILNVDELFVKTEYRSRGIGTEFFSFIDKMENIAALRLETTPDNLRAFDYYKRMGFVPDGNNHLIKKA